MEEDKEKLLYHIYKEDAIKQTMDIDDFVEIIREILHDIP